MKRIKRTISIIVSIAMLLVLLPTVAMAEGPATQTADFTSGDGSAALALLNAAKTPDAADSTWDKDSKTLTLRGVNFTTTATSAVELPGDSTIILADGTENTITGGSTASGGCYGIYAEGNLTITIPGGAVGTGTLTVTGGDITAAAGAMPFESTGIYACGSVTISGGTVNATGGNITRGNGTASFKSYGIYAGNGVTISGGIVTAQSSTAPNRSYGIYAESGNIAVTGGIVTATGRAAYYSYGIDAHVGSVTIENGGKVIAASGAAGENGAGIYAYGSVTISGSTTEVTANGDTAGNNSYGIEALNGNVTISGGTVQATGGNAADKSCGIYASTGNVTISDSTTKVTATGGTSDWTSYGIYADDVAISGSAEVDATGGAADWLSYGIYACAVGGSTGTVTISGGTVKAMGSAADVGSIGIYADGVAIQGGTVTAAGDETDYGSTGIYANDTVEITGGTVQATGDTADEFSDGICADHVTISGGTVTATSGATNAEDGESTGIYAYETVTINGGTVILDTGAAGNTVLGGGTLTLAPVAPAVIERTGEAEPLVQKYADTPVVFSDVSRTTVTVTDITANDKPYDGTTAATLTGGALTDVDSGDTVSLGTADVTATFDNANAGTDKAVTVSGTFDLRGNDAYKYSLTQPDLTGLTASIAPCTTVFDTTEHVQTIYKGTGTFDQPHIIGLFDDPDSDNQFVDTETGTITYMVSGTEIEAGVYDDVVNYLKTLDSGTEVTITYQFTGNANYEGATFADNGSDSATNTGRITIKVIDRPSSGGGSVSTYAISLSDTANGDITASHKRASRGTTVTVTVTPDEGYELNTLTATDASGNQLTLTGKDNGIYTFTMPASKVDLAATFTEIQKAPVNPFTDVKEGEYYYEAVLWAAENGITEGTSDTTFSPNAPCTRAQIVTFLWRAAGSPAPKSSSNPFVDVSADAYYYSAVLWAVENGITNGTSDGSTFSPDAVCSRSEAVTFLHRAKGSPAAATHNTFTDVPSGAWYASAVDWAVEQQITNGTGGNTFSPAADCTRAQIITFLYRTFAK